MHISLKQVTEHLVYWCMIQHNGQNLVRYLEVGNDTPGFTPNKGHDMLSGKVDGPCNFVSVFSDDDVQKPLTKKVFS